MAKSLDAALTEAAEACDRLVKEADERIPNYEKDGKLVHEEHPTEAQILGIVRDYVSAERLGQFEGGIEEEVRKRMKSKGWEYKPAPAAATK